MRAVEHRVGLFGNGVSDDRLGKGDNPAQAGFKSLGAVARGRNSGDDHAALLWLDENQAGAHGGQSNGGQQDNAQQADHPLEAAPLPSRSPDDKQD